MPNLQSYRRLPPIQSDYVLDDVWAVVVPIQRTNEILNSSAETNTTGYTAGSGTLTRSTEQQYHGAYSFKYVPAAGVTDGFYYTLTSTVAIRAVSCKFRGAAGVPYALTYATSAGVDLVTKTFTATGIWQWIVLYYNDASATTRRIYFRKNSSASTAAFHVDGVQSEVINAGELVSTFISGDEQGLVPNQNPAPYYWTGTPHASTSVRSAQTRAGGMVIPFKKYGFLLTAIVGLGLAQPTNEATSYARIDGAYDDYTRKAERQFTLTGRFQGATYRQLRDQRNQIAQLLDRDLTGQDQQLTLLRWIENTNGEITTATARLYGKYAGGLDGSTDNMHAETTPITFINYMPGILADGEDGESLSVQTSVSNANQILQRSAAGVWSAMGTGGTLAGTVEAMLVGRDGTVYAGGAFTAMNGVANTSRIAAWNPTTQTWSALGTGITGGGTLVLALAQAPNGDIIASGTFTGAGGVANTNRLAKWNGSAWSSITPTIADNSVTAVAYDNLGNLYATGSFANINGVAAAAIAKYDGSTWTALGTGLAGGAGNVLLIDASNNVYVGGSFTSAGGVANTSRIAKWNGSAWSALGSGLDSTVRALTFDNAGGLYAGGQFTASGSTTLTSLGRWNGTAWLPLGTGTSGGTNTVTELTWAGEQNQLYIGGTFTGAGNLTLPDSVAIWNGAGFAFADVDLPASSQVNAIVFGLDDTLYFGFDQSGTATAGSTTTITNTGTGRAYPQIRLTGPTSGAASRIWNITNVTTGRALYFNYLMNVGEIATLSLRPDNLSFQSNVQGDILGKIVAGSNTADFFLQPGANVITMLSASSTVTATIYWRPVYATLDSVQ